MYKRQAVLRDKEIFLGQCDSFHGERLFARIEPDLVDTGRRKAVETQPLNNRRDSQEAAIRAGIGDFQRLEHLVANLEITAELVVLRRLENVGRHFDLAVGSQIAQTYIVPVGPRTAINGSRIDRMNPVLAVVIGQDAVSLSLIHISSEEKSRATR